MATKADSIGDSLAVDPRVFGTDVVQVSSVSLALGISQKRHFSWMYGLAILRGGAERESQGFK
jgi:hypothetical protein